METIYRVIKRFLVKRTLQAKIQEMFGAHGQAGVEVVEWVEAMFAFARKPTKKTLASLHREWMGVYNSTKPLLPED